MTLADHWYAYERMAGNGYAAQCAFFCGAYAVLSLSDDDIRKARVTVERFFAANERHIKSLSECVEAEGEVKLQALCDAYKKERQ